MIARHHTRRVLRGADAIPVHPLPSRYVTDPVTGWKSRRVVKRPPRPLSTLVVGDPANNHAVIVSTYRDLADNACRCGTLVCSHLGPCAPAQTVAAPQPYDARKVLDDVREHFKREYTTDAPQPSKPRPLAAGGTVRCVREAFTGGGPKKGVCYVIRSFSDDGFWIRLVGVDSGWHASLFEPVEPASEALPTTERAPGPTRAALAK